VATTEITVSTSAWFYWELTAIKIPSFYTLFRDIVPESWRCNILTRTRRSFCRLKPLSTFATPYWHQRECISKSTLSFLDFIEHRRHLRVVILGGTRIILVIRSEATILCLAFKDNILKAGRIGTPPVFGGQVSSICIEMFGLVGCRSWGLNDLVDYTNIHISNQRDQLGRL
jgi:hypothetical protein